MIHDAGFSISPSLVINMSDCDQRNGPNGISVEVLKAPKNTFEKYLFPKIMTRLLKIIHKPCSEQSYFLSTRKQVGLEDFTIERDTCFKLKQKNSGPRIKPWGTPLHDEALILMVTTT